MLDLIIIGAGPAGMSACLYASRAGLDVLILDGSAPGGKLNVTAQNENYPGLNEYFVRFAVRTREENDELIDALTEILA